MSRVAPPCPCGKCNKKHGFCKPHKERLAKIAEELVLDAGQYQQRSDQRQPGHKNFRRPATCCNPACYRPRDRGQRFCFDCQADGWSEDVYE